MDVLPLEECLELLRSATPVGRIAIVANGFPIVLPVNYRLVEVVDQTWLALRTRPGNILDHAEVPAAFEIDHIDPLHHEGWSFLVRGTLHHADAYAATFRERFDPEPWITSERDAWLIIQPFEITGRRVRAPEGEWAFNVHAYL